MRMWSAVTCGLSASPMRRSSTALPFGSCAIARMVVDMMLWVLRAVVALGALGDDSQTEVMTDASTVSKMSDMDFDCMQATLVSLCVWLTEWKAAVRS